MTANQRDVFWAVKMARVLIGETVRKLEPSDTDPLTVAVLAIQDAIERANVLLDRRKL